MQLKCYTSHGNVWLWPYWFSWRLCLTTSCQVDGSHLMTCNFIHLGESWELELHSQQFQNNGHPTCQHMTHYKRNYCSMTRCHFICHGEIESTIYILVILKQHMSKNDQLQQETFWVLHTWNEKKTKARSILL